MPVEVRPTTIDKIEKMLDESYFTKESFSIHNDLNVGVGKFLSITFTPDPRFDFAVALYQEDDGQYYQTEEAPGEHMTSREIFRRASFDDCLWAIPLWISRIKEDFDARKRTEAEVEEFLDDFRKRIDESEDLTGDFSVSETAILREKLDRLQELVGQQGKRLDASEHELDAFRKEVEDIKSDLTSFPKKVWYKVSANKLLRATGKFLKSKEGRALLIEGVRKLLS